jgi:two-component system, chemotaxis family, protein-glutamate methylesterase/glutaminase
MEEDRMTGQYKLLVIGGSAGSLEVIMQLLPGLDRRNGLAVVIVLHRKSNESVLVDLLSDITLWTVKEVEEKDSIEPGVIYLAPADYHLLIEKDWTFSLDFSEKVNYSRPSIDVTFESAADVFGPALVCLLLSGANADGTAGMRLVKKMGGLALVQDPLDAAVSYMPQQAIDSMKVDKIVKAAEMAVLINGLNG